jgi:hypothetical protein
MELSLKKRPWWDYIGEDIRELLFTSQDLINRAETWEEKFHDYSFLVFPAAKAYEGFLKKLFLDMNFISEKDYYGKRFRIGKALNPYLDRRIRKRESVYDRLVNYCGGTNLADNLWDTWKNSRNLVFHWFPEEKKAISLEEGREKVRMIITAMDDVFEECKIK